MRQACDRRTNKRPGQNKASQLLSRGLGGAVSAEGRVSQATRRGRQPRASSPFPLSRFLGTFSPSRRSAPRGVGQGPRASERPGGAVPSSIFLVAPVAAPNDGHSARFGRCCRGILPPTKTTYNWAVRLAGWLAGSRVVSRPGPSPH